MFGNYQKLPKSKNKKINEALRLLEKGVSQVKVTDISGKAIPRLNHLCMYGIDMTYDSSKKVLILDRSSIFKTWI